MAIYLLWCSSSESSIFTSKILGKVYINNNKLRVSFKTNDTKRKKNLTKTISQVLKLFDRYEEDILEEEYIYR